MRYNSFIEQVALTFRCFGVFAAKFFKMLSLQAPVAQLDRAAGFEPSPIKTHTCGVFFTHKHLRSVYKTVYLPRIFIGFQNTHKKTVASHINRVLSSETWLVG